MKKISVSLLLLLAILSALVLGSCAGAEEKVNTTVHVKIEAGSVVYVDKDITLKTSADDENGPSVSDAIKYLIDNEDLTIELDKQGVSLMRVGDYFDTTYEVKPEEDGKKPYTITYYWDYTVNGAAPSAGKADTNYLKDNDTLVYSFTAMVPNPDKKDEFITSPYDNESKVFEEILKESEETGDAETGEENAA